MSQRLTTDLNSEPWRLDWQISVALEHTWSTLNIFEQVTYNLLMPARWQFQWTIQVCILKSLAMHVTPSEHGQYRSAFSSPLLCEWRKASMDNTGQRSQVPCCVNDAKRAWTIQASILKSLAVRVMPSEHGQYRSAFSSPSLDIFKSLAVHVRSPCDVKQAQTIRCLLSTPLLRMWGQASGSGDASVCTDGTLPEGWDTKLSLTWPGRVG